MILNIQENKEENEEQQETKAFQLDMPLKV